MIPAVKDSVVPKTRPALTYGKIEIATPVVLAPMAGITNTAFRRLCREFGGGLYVSEMVTSRALVERTEESMRLIGHHSSEEVRSVQLYGVDPKTISEAITMLIAEDRADHIDLNFGCPVPKVTRKGGGAALPWKQDLFSSILTAAVKAAGDIPLTIKMRKGIDADHLTFLDAGKAARDAGVTKIYRTPKILSSIPKRFFSLVALSAESPPKTRGSPCRAGHSLCRSPVCLASRPLALHG